MRFETITDPADFLDRAGPLLTDEARHNLILGIATNLIETPDLYDDYRFLLVTSDEAVRACGLITIPHRVIVADAPDEKALAVLVEGVARADFDVPGVVGNMPTVERFMTSWIALTGSSAELAMAQGVFALEKVNPAPQTSGEAKVAVEEDFETTFAWFNAFIDEALPTEPRDEERMRGLMRKRLRGEAPGAIWLWEVDGEPVSMSAHSGRTRSGARINAVYTPPRFRAHGYASALVAAQSQWLLDNDHERCFLYTDLANPTSNKIYESIGYRRVAEAASYDFTPAT